MTLDITQFYQTFFDEADELLAEMERLLLGLDVANPELEDLNAIFRSAHSIKGGAATFGFAALTDTTHILESLLDRARTGELTLRTDMVDLFLDTKDVLHELVQALRASTDPDPDLVSSMCARLQALADEETAKAAGAAAPVAAAPAAAPPPPPKPAAPAPAPVAAAPADPSDPPGHLIKQLQEISGHAPAGSADAESADTDADDGVAGVPCLKIRLSGVGERDRDLLVEEVGNLGTILERTQEGSVLTVWLQSDCNPDDIIAVCCFVIDADQIDVKLSSYVARTVLEEVLATPATAPEPAPAPTLLTVTPYATS